MNIKSDKKEILRPREEIFHFLNDFNNFEKLMPEQITDWAATKENCSFEISGMATIELRITEIKEPEFQKIESEGKSPFPFSLLTNLDAIDPQNTSVVFEIDADINPMMSMMVKKPLQNIVDIMTDKLKEHMEASN